MLAPLSRPIMKLFIFAVTLLACASGIDATYPRRSLAQASVARKNSFQRKHGAGKASLASID